MPAIDPEQLNADAKRTAFHVTALRRLESEITRYTPVRDRLCRGQSSMLMRNKALYGILDALGPA